MPTQFARKRPAVPSSCGRECFCKLTRVSAILPIHRRVLRSDETADRLDQDPSEELSMAENTSTADNADIDPDSDDDPSERRSPALIATAIALPVALIVGVVIAAVVAGNNPELSPVALGPVPAPAAESEPCVSLLGALPDKIDDFTKAELVDPAPAGAAAWQRSEGEPIVLRCGLDRPTEFDQAAALQVVNGVQWFQVSGTDVGLAASTWFAVDRGEYIGITIPDGTGPTPIQEISDTITATLEQKPLDPAPVAVP
jgi:hypothetical protein